MFPYQYNADSSLWRSYGILKPIRTSVPAISPVSLALVKRHLRVEGTEEDLLIAAFIEAATSHLDGYSGIVGRALITQEWTQQLPQFPYQLFPLVTHSHAALRLAVPPVQTITEIKYYDTDNVLQTLSADVYTLREDALGPRVSLNVSKVWPVTYCREDAVTVTYAAGYGDRESDVPMAIRQALLLLVGHWFENRETTAGAAMSGLNSELPFAVSALLTPFRRGGP